MAINPLQQPIDYTAQMPDISRQFAGLSTALGELGERRRQEQAAQQAEQQAQAAQAEFSRDLEAAIQGGRAQDFVRLAAKYPGMKDMIKDARESLGEERIKNEFDTGARISMLFENDQPELAREQIQTIIEAGRNSGQPVGTYEDIAKLYDAGNVAGAQAATNFALMMADPERMKTYGEAAAKIGEEERAQANFPAKQAKDRAELAKLGADLGLTQQQIARTLAETEKLGIETRQAAFELEAAMQPGGDIDPKEKFGQEEKIRKEWQGRSKLYNELQGTFANLQASAETASGAGDIALITAFLKMLDPGSVVRETEFATAQNTAGLFAQLENRLQAVESGELLKPTQRQQYVSLAQKYLDAAQRQAEKEKNNLNAVVRNYNLNPENVFGVTTDAVDENNPLLQ